ncbi:MAG: allantoicase [Candidatus Marinimicrobia bacterium]|nr:allantoicase [Candidatus Neomarinimicrobiota bacterium]
MPKLKKDLIDLASESNGGRTLLASDEFFAPKENLLKPGRGEFISDKYTDRGKWMDGWESRRKRTPGHDWCILRLGKPGVIKELDIDTNHFVGNFPSHASVDACQVPPFTALGEIMNEVKWTEILSRVELQGDSQNQFAIYDEESFTHLRLNIYPDGGVARIRVYGNPEDGVRDGNDFIDVALSDNGGETLACSDMHFSHMENLIKTGFGLDMSDGWETKRRRGPGHDWVILKLGSPCSIERIVVDTYHFKGNFPDSCSLEGCFEPDTDRDAFLTNTIEWKEVLTNLKLSGNQENIFVLNETLPCTHIRFNIYPDGGVSRLRIMGRPVL